MNENEKQTNSASTLEILEGGASISVQLLPDKPGGVGGGPETVKVVKVSMRNLPELAAAWGKEAREIAVYTNKKPDDPWLDRLSEESWELILREGRRMNFLAFKRFFARNQEALEAIAPMTDERIKAAVEAAMTETAAVTGSARLTNS